MTVEIRSGRGVVFFWTYLSFPNHPLLWDDYTWHERVR